MPMHTCGFWPEHLLWTPELERAIMIVGHINDVYIATHILPDYAQTALRALAALEGVSLMDMMRAKERVESWNDRPTPPGATRALYCIPDDRLVAAVYTLINYGDSASVGRDSLIVLVQRPTETTFLAVGVRGRNNQMSEAA